MHEQTSSCGRSYSEEACVLYDHYIHYDQVNRYFVICRFWGQNITSTTGLSPPPHQLFSQRVQALNEIKENPKKR